MKTIEEKLEVMRNAINKLGKRTAAIENYLDINKDTSDNTVCEPKLNDDRSLDELKKIIGL